MALMKKSIGVLESGGLDSAALLAELSEKYRTILPIYIRQGLVWEKVELYWLKRFLSALRRGNKRIQPLKIFSLPMADVYGAHWSTGAGRSPGARSADSAVYLP